jgi:hypothetical protein
VGPKENEQKDKHELRNITQFKMNLTKNGGDPRYSGRVGICFLQIDAHTHLASVIVSLFKKNNMYNVQEYKILYNNDVPVM